MTTQNKILIGVGGILFLLLATLFTIRLLNGEDGWICVDKQWVRHGNPSASAPTSGCGELTKDTSVVPPVIQQPVQPVYLTRLYEPQELATGVAKKLITTSPLVIKGAMPGNWFFEASAVVKLLDANGKGLGGGLAQAKGDWMTDKLVPFEASLKFDVPTTATGVLILQADNPSGLPENDKQEKYIVNFWPTVKVFFNNDKFDPNLLDCAKVYPVNRSIAPTVAVARAALEELFKGLMAGERDLGYLTNLNSGVKIQKLTIENGIAKVDFSSELERAVGGSCKTGAIRAQITETLKQFPTVNSVIISINGRVEDILQP